jgi:hypothetical protein
MVCFLSIWEINHSQMLGIALKVSWMGCFDFGNDEQK